MLLLLLLLLGHNVGRIRRRIGAHHMGLGYNCARHGGHGVPARDGGGGARCCHGGIPNHLLGHAGVGVLLGLLLKLKLH